MTDKTPRKKRTTNKEVLERMKYAEENKDKLHHVKLVDLPPVSVNFPDRKAAGLKGQITTGTLFIGDTGFFADTAQNYPDGIIKDDPTNPFKDWDKFIAKHGNDCNVDLPGSFNGDLPGRGIVIQTNMLSGSYTVEREECPSTGKLLSVKVMFRD